MHLAAEQESKVPANSAVVVRSGALRCRIDGRPVIFDVNHVLVVPRGASCLAVTAQTPSIAVAAPLAGSCIGSAPQVLLVDACGFLRAPFEITASRHQGHAGCSAYCAAYAFAMQDFVNRSIGQPPFLRDIAAACGLSPFAASRLFHRHAGISLRGYLKRLRLRNSLLRLLAGDEIATVAYDFGFCDHAHFSNAFRSEFGAAPTEWRIRASSGIQPDPRAVGQ